MYPADLKDRVAVVTGAGRGIGRSLALRLAGLGAKTVLAARTSSELEETASQIRATGGAAMPVPCDIGDEEAVTSLFRTVQDEHGRLDVLINNAGLGVFGPVAEFSTADLDRVMQVNVRGTFLCCREAMQLMIPHHRGTIINISSVVGIKGYPNQSAYSAAKHAVMGLTKALAVEAQEHGVRVSAILPGGVDTEMVREARPDLDPADLLGPGDVADAVTYLLSLSDRAAVDQIVLRRRGSAPF